MRPGPSSIPRGEYPGGMVIHVYDLRGVLLATSHVGSDDDVEGEAGRAATAAITAGGDVCLVAFDGDSGVRLRQRDWFG